MESSPPRYFLVRTKRDLVEKSIIGIGWSRINFSEYTTDMTGNDLIKSIKGSYKIGRRRLAILRFFKMKEGDVIVVPLDKTIAIGIIKENGQLFYSESETDIKKDRSNQRNVEFYARDNKIITFARENLSNAFQKIIKVPGGVVKEISKFKDQIENIIESIKTDKSFRKLTWIQEEGQNRVTFTSTLLTNIKNGRTYLRAGGIGLEYLVRDLLIMDGYKAEVLGKQKFKGFADADIKAIKAGTSESTKFTNPKLLVQVKHHQGTTGAWGIKQLEQINKNHDNYIDHQLVLVTSAKINSDLRKKAVETDIRIIEGEELAGWIFDNLGKLSSKMKATLGIAEKSDNIPAT